MNKKQGGVCVCVFFWSGWPAVIFAFDDDDDDDDEEEEEEELWWFMMMTMMILKTIQTYIFFVFKLSILKFLPMPHTFSP